MPLFRAIELSVDSADPTGRVEYYQARGKKAAAKKLLYTRRLQDGRCKLGPTGLVVSCGKTAWVIIKRGK
ncbi:MAG: hypothetical protein MN733_36020 [Nitrososphaera sp.]|nr:hypothetical protein [Nitrososphaera sp.]